MRTCERERQRERQRDRERQRETKTETDRQADRQAGRQTDRQTDRQTEGVREKAGNCDRAILIFCQENKEKGRFSNGKIQDSNVFNGKDAHPLQL